MFLFMKDAFCAHQGCIYLIKNTVKKKKQQLKNTNIVKYKQLKITFVY